MPGAVDAMSLSEQPTLLMLAPSADGLSGAERHHRDPCRGQRFWGGVEATVEALAGSSRQQTRSG